MKFEIFCRESEEDLYYQYFSLSIFNKIVKIKIMKVVLIINFKYFNLMSRS